MPFPVPDTFRVVCLFTVAGGDTMVNVFHVTNAGFGELTQVGTDVIGDAFASAWGDNIQGRVNGGVTFTEVVVTDLRELNGPQFVFNVAAAGTGAGEMLPPQDAAVITWRTARTGRSFRGRTFLGGFTETDNSTLGFLSTTLEGLIGDYAQQLLDTVDALSVVSRFQEGIEIDPPQSNPITSFVVRPAWRTQRRRQF